eukprot:2539697-Amphidinium_carterae.1
MATLARTCSGSHSHLPWTMNKKNGLSVAPVETAMYPNLFCSRFTACVASHARTLGFALNEQQTELLHYRLDRQPRRGLGPLLPEFLAE